MTKLDNVILEVNRLLTDNPCPLTDPNATEEEKDAYSKNGLALYNSVVGMSKLSS